MGGGVSSPPTWNRVNVNEAFSEKQDFGSATFFIRITFKIKKYTMSICQSWIFINNTYDNMILEVGRHIVKAVQ